MRVLIFTALVAVCLAAGFLFGRAVRMWRNLRRRDDLMALADSLRLCGAVSRGYEPGHLWHDCKRVPGHERGRSDTSRDMGWVPDVTHHCRCGVRWAMSTTDAQQIALLDRMLGADAYEPDRRTS